MTAVRPVLALSSDSPLSPDTRPELGDLRFRSLLSEREWADLSPCVRARFSKRLSGGNTIVYVGDIVEAHFSAVGRLLAHFARLIGGPFPIARDIGVPSVVTVTEDIATGGQIWTRLYARRNGMPQVIHSSKRFEGDTGLEEHVGYGVGMSLCVSVVEKAIVFRSARYFVNLFGKRIALPRWLTPGALTVTHTECSEDEFTFTLEVAHPVFGSLIRQVGKFKEVQQ